MLRRGLQSLNLARRRFGFPLLSDPVAQLRAADRLFIASSKHFDFVLEPDPWITYLGPQFYTVGSHWRGTAVRSNGLPYIVVAFSTAFQNHLAVLGRIAQALGKLPVHAAFTLGHDLSASDFVAPPNVTVLQTAPHDELMGQAQLIITRGGHGTVLRAICHGAPILCMPLGRDNFDNAARIVARGIGKSISATANPVEIMNAIECVLSDSATTRTARELSQLVCAEIASHNVVQEFESLASS